MERAVAMINLQESTPKFINSCSRRFGVNGNVNYFWKFQIDVEEAYVMYDPEQKQKDDKIAYYSLQLVMILQISLKLPSPNLCKKLQDIMKANFNPHLTSCFKI